MAEAHLVLGRVRRLRTQRVPMLVFGRMVEQCALGGAAIYLAARLGPDAFAPVSVLFVINTVAVTLADYGVGLSVLRCAPGETVGRGALYRMRGVNVLLAISTVVAGLVVGGNLGWVIAAAGPIWWAASEAFVRKAAAINLGSAPEAANGEMAGAAVFAAMALGAIELGTPIAWVGLAFLLKHVGEAACVRTWRPAFADHGQPGQFGALFSGQGLALVAGNVDYVLVGLCFGARAFSIYTLGFRVAVAVPSIVAYVAGRTAVADFASLAGNDLDECHHTYVRRLFNAGLVGVLGAVGAVVVLPPILGGAWHDIGPTLLVLAVVMPWRTVFGEAGALMVATGHAGLLARWELVRVAVSLAVLSVAGLVSYPVFVTAVAVLWVVVAWSAHRIAATAAGVSRWRRSTAIGGAGVVVCVVVAALAGWS